MCFLGMLWIECARACVLSPNPLPLYSLSSATPHCAHSFESLSCLASQHDYGLFLKVPCAGGGVWRDEVSAKGGGVSRGGASADSFHPLGQRAAYMPISGRYHSLPSEGWGDPTRYRSLPCSGGGLNPLGDQVMISHTTHRTHHPFTLPLSTLQLFASAPHSTPQRAHPEPCTLHPALCTAVRHPRRPLPRPPPVGSAPPHLLGQYRVRHQLPC